MTAVIRVNLTFITDSISSTDNRREKSWSEDDVREVMGGNWDSFFFRKYENESIFVISVCGGDDHSCGI
jgi:hypothetical protein